MCQPIGYHLAGIFFQLTERVNFFLAVVMCWNVSLLQMCLQDIFFSTSPNPPPLKIAPSPLIAEYPATYLNNRFLCLIKPRCIRN